MAQDKTAEEILESRIKQHHGSEYLTPCTICAQAAMESYASQQVQEARREDVEVLSEARKVFATAEEERYELLEECRQRAEECKRKDNDMYGWNFHMGMSGGANWADIMYQRVDRFLAQAIEVKAKEVK